MQSLFRVINIVFGPVLTLLFASRFAGVQIAGKDAGDVLGGVAAGLVMLAVELVLTEGPRHSAWLRRWLDPRAAFEGMWLQDVFEGQEGNSVAVFSFDYERDGDTYSVLGHAYSADGGRWAKWRSTQVFIDKASLSAVYLWEGELLRHATSDADKTGKTELELRRPPVFSLPMTGDGSVAHVDEKMRVKFRLRRVTRRLLDELGLRFTVRELRLDAGEEEAQLVAAYRKARGVMTAAQSRAA